MNSRDMGASASHGTGYCGFEVGQHVVLIDDNWNTGYSYAHITKVPAKGVVYTVRAIEARDKQRVGLLLREIVNVPRRHADGHLEISFRATRFRPLPKLTPEQFLTVETPVDGKAVPA